MCLSEKFILEVIFFKISITWLSLKNEEGPKVTWLENISR